MPLTETQVLADTPRRYAVKRVNVGNTETAAVFVNAAALSYGLSVLTLTAGANTFRAGELVNAASGGAGIVQSHANSTTLNLINANGTFTPGTNVTGNLTGSVRVTSGAINVIPKTLHVVRIAYDIGGPADAKLELDWEGSPAGASNNRALVVLSGQGVLELDTHGVRANNNAVNATGNILLSTLNWTANTHYTLLVDISKGTGFEPVSLDSNF